MTTEARIPTKAELLDALRSSEQRILEKLGALPAEHLEQGRYADGWNGREILAHVASIEWTYTRLFDLAREGSAPPASERPPEVRRTEPQQAAGVPTRIAQGGILSYNDRQVEKRKDASVAELIEEFRTNRAATIAAVEQADDGLLRTPIRSTGGITGALGSVLYAVAVQHVLSHVNDIAGDQGASR